MNRSHEVYFEISERTMIISLFVGFFSLVPFLLGVGPFLDEMNGHYTLTDERREINIRGLILWFSGVAIIMGITLSIDFIQYRLEIQKVKSVE